MTPRSLLAPARLAGQPILRSQSDERLVDLVRAGYDPAFEAIVTRYRRALLRYAHRLLNDERAEDAVQQTFVNAYDAMLSGTAELKLRPWLYRIAHNNSLNALRDRGLRHEQLSESIDGVERPDQAFERRQGLRDVVASVQALPPRQRDALVLQAVEGRSYEEIAYELGVSDGSVRQLLNRARNNLRAAATAITPLGLMTRIPWDSADPVGARITELTTGAGAGALATKVAATLVVTGAVAGGVATIERPGTQSATSDEAGAQSAAPAAGGEHTTTVPGAPRGRSARQTHVAQAQSDPGTGRPGEQRSARHGRNEDRSGHDGSDDRSGPGRLGAEDGGSGSGGEDHSGPGSGGAAPATPDDSSGPGPGGSTATVPESDDHSGAGSGSDDAPEPLAPPDD